MFRKKKTSKLFYTFLILETDFYSIMNEVIVLPVNTSKYVINIDIKEDIIFEKTESFRVTLNLEEGSQTVLGKISSTEINIFDNDSMYIVDVLWYS